jgi:hypothetical protein
MPSSLRNPEVIVVGKEADNYKADCETSDSIKLVYISNGNILYYKFSKSLPIS